MGIYLFNRDTLVDVLEKTDYQDFGKEVFPASIRSRHVQVHLFDGYWEDIGTIKSFFEANLSLAASEPPFALFSPEAPIYSHARFLPPTRVDGATVQGSLLADGCQIDPGARIENSIIGLRCLIGRDAVIRNSILMGNDFYQAPADLDDDVGNGRPPLGIGPGSHIEGAIIDKNCHIGRNVQIMNAQGLDATEEDDYGMIQDGIVVIPKGATLPDDWSM
jgi:glucose-1-phosphate adenylyltransferase